MNMNDQNPTDAILAHDDSRAGLDTEKIDDLFSICSPTQAGALGLLAQSKSLGVAPAPFLEAFARELKDFDRIRVQKLAAECREGVPLIDVFESGERFFPPPVILAMRLAHDSNKLDELCESISGRPIYSPEMTGLSEQSPLRRIMSVIWKGLVIFWIMAFVMLFVIPQFQDMFMEFGVELPEITLLLIKFLRCSASSGSSSWLWQRCLGFGTCEAVGLKFVRCSAQHCGIKRNTHPLSRQS